MSTPDLSRTLFWCNIADYADTDMSQRRARQLVAWAQALVSAVACDVSTPSEQEPGRGKDQTDATDGGVLRVMKPGKKLALAITVQ